MPTAASWEVSAVVVLGVTCVPLLSLQGESSHQTPSAGGSRLRKGIWLPGFCC